jgi:hypothetical protein
MSFPYKNPTSGIQLTTPNSVLLTDTFGTNFSVYNIGGYMEVYSLRDLEYSTFGETGNILNSGNTIPVSFYKRPVSTLTDRITLWSDGISSGRRKLGMLVYVHEVQQTYQYTIPNYETLWDNASLDGCITSGASDYTISNRVGGVEKLSGQELIEAWTGSTIEGVSGVTREDARWKIFYGTDTTVTGGTYDEGVITFTNTTGGTFNVTGLTSDDTYLTGATYTPTTLTLGMSDDTEFEVSGFAPEITGGTYSAGTISLLDNTGGQVNITGISQADISIYNSDGQLTSRRVVNQSGNELVFSGGSVSMGNNITFPSCALLELASDNQGLLIPRMTQEQRLAIDTPLPGLLVYCTNTDGNGQEGMYMYKSNGWVNIL